MTGPSTRAVHGGHPTHPLTGAVNPAIELSATFRYPELEDGSPAPYIYGRYTNPSVEHVEEAVRSLEGAEGTLAFASGMSAISSLAQALLGPGKGLVHQRGIYGGTGAYFANYLANQGVPISVAETDKPEIPEGTALVWMESITNPLLRVADVEVWAKAAHDAGALLAVDATFASPILQRPLELGADIVMHSGTKYLGGHSDLLAGLLSWKKGVDGEALQKARRDLGGMLDPHAAYLLGRGIKTLVLRVERQCANAAYVAHEAQNLPGVRHMHYPGLSHHPDHRVARRLLSAYGGMLTMDLGNLEAAKAFRRNLEIIIPAASLGGVESLASLPLETSHQYASAESRRADGITDGLVRISIGIEDKEDILADIRQALEP